MGEYAQSRVSGQRVKIGTCEDMMYLRYDQRHLVRALDGNVDPVKDQLELRFRFPFPDEDHVAPGNFDDHDRGFEVAGYEPARYMLEALDAGVSGPVAIVQQKAVQVTETSPEGHNDTKLQLQTVVRVPVEGSYFGSLFRLDLEQALKMMVALAEEAKEALTLGDPYRAGELMLIASRVAKGYTSQPILEAV